MRPAYQTRCWQCGEKITVADEWQFEKVKVGDKVVTVKWFDPDRIVLQHIRKVH
jgi:hypothetical protein